MTKRLAVPWSVGLGMDSEGMADSEEGVAGVGPPVVGGFESAKNR